MRRWISLAVTLLVLLTAAPAEAASDWDPDDVASPLDLRWVGARFARDSSFVLTISFYDGFRPAAIQRSSQFRQRRQVWVEISAHIAGFLHRRAGGGIELIWGDMASNCCSKDRMSYLSENVLTVTVPIIDDNNPYRVRVISTWIDRDGERVLDRTEVMRLGLPPDE